MELVELLKNIVLACIEVLNELILADRRRGFLRRIRHKAVWEIWVDLAGDPGGKRGSASLASAQTVARF